MTTVLRLNTSILGADSVSRQLSGELLDGLRRRYARLEVIERDFAVDPVPHLDGEWLSALATPQADRSDEQQRRAGFSDALIGELRAADVILVALPMYNFAVPSMLKAWFDHVARAGETFRYTDSGPEGLLQGKKAWLVAAILASSGTRRSASCAEIFHAASSPHMMIAKISSSASFLSSSMWMPPCFSISIGRISLPSQASSWPRW